MNLCKTTIIKQLKKIHKLRDDDAGIMGPYIQDTSISYMKLLCHQCAKLSEKRNENKEKLFYNYYYCRNEKLIIGYIRYTQNEYNKLLIPLDLAPLIVEFYPMDTTNIDITNAKLMAELDKLPSPYNFQEDQLVNKIRTLWKDIRIKETLKLRAHYQIHDNVEYCLNQIEDILKDDYEPTFDDYIRIRTRSTGFLMTTIKKDFNELGDYIFEITDPGGARSERKRWISYMRDQIDCFVYVIAISKYDMKLFEDNKTNRLVAAINLFREVVGRFNWNKIKVFSYCSINMISLKKRLKKFQ